MRSSIAAVTAGIASSVLRDSIAGTRFTITGVIPGELRPKETYLYNGIKSVAINNGVCNHLFGHPTCSSITGLLQYPLKAATKLMLSDVVDHCVDMALSDPAAKDKEVTLSARGKSCSYSSILARTKETQNESIRAMLTAKKATKKPSFTTADYWKHFVREVVANSVADIVYDVGRRRAEIANSGSVPSLLDTATWAFAAAAAGDFIRAKLDTSYTPEYVKSGVKSGIFKTSFSYFYAFIMASSD